LEKLKKKWMRRLSQRLFPHFFNKSKKSSKNVAKNAIPAFFMQYSLVTQSAIFLIFF